MRYKVGKTSLVFLENKGIILRYSLIFLKKDVKEMYKMKTFYSIWRGKKYGLDKKMSLKNLIFFKAQKKRKIRRLKK